MEQQRLPSVINSSMSRFRDLLIGGAIIAGTCWVTKTMELNHKSAECIKALHAADERRELESSYLATQKMQQCQRDEYSNASQKARCHAQGEGGEGDSEKYTGCHQGFVCL